MLYYIQEVREMKRTRNSIKYRIFHWFNTLSYNDFIHVKNIIVYWVVEILTILLLFFFIFIIPHLFG